MYKSQFILLLILLTLPQSTGGPICYRSCVAVVGTAGLVGSDANLPALGFTSAGVTAGSLAAGWMASFKGSVSAGSLFARLQSAGASGSSWGLLRSVSNVCTVLCAPLP